MDGFMISMVITGLFGLLIAVFGFYMSITGRGAMLIAGFNTMSKEKEKYDSVALCKFIGKYIFLVGVSTIFFAYGLSQSINDDGFNDLLFWITTGVYCFLVTGGGVYVAICCNTGNRFKK